MTLLRQGAKAAVPAPATPRRRSRRAGRVLWVIATFLFASGLARLGDGTGLAIAREIGALATAATAAAPKRSDDTPGVEELLAALRAREARLAEAEARLDERERALSVAEE
ncbi:MAG: hypothetical protein OEM24_06660, partial [Paracoccaceae bacterium]|nr:hypothetical protein [Paracoccaceae bacterium]